MVKDLIRFVRVPSAGVLELVCKLSLFDTSNQWSNPVLDCLEHKPNKNLISPIHALFGSKYESTRQDALGTVLTSSMGKINPCINGFDGGSGCGTI